MKKEVTRYLIEKTLLNGNKIWFGKNKKIVEANNPSNGWEVKEYGYKTEGDAKRGLQSLKFADERQGQYGNKYSITSPLKIYFNKDYTEYNLDCERVEYAVEVYDKNDHFKFQIDVLDTLDEAIKYIEDVPCIEDIEADDHYGVLKIIYDENENEINTECVYEKQVNELINDEIERD